LQGSGTKIPLLKRSSIVKKEGTPIKTVDKEKLIEVEKSETGSVKRDVYLHYFKAIGLKMGLFTICFNVLYQGK
jgi:ATP-binding cassette subfamily C (CFTR/MRP) protein 1